MRRKTIAGAVLLLIVAGCAWAQGQTPAQSQGSSSVTNVGLPGPLYAGKSCEDVGKPTAWVHAPFVDGFIRDKVGNPVVGIDVNIGLLGNVPSTRTDNHGHYFIEVSEGYISNPSNRILKLMYGGRVVDQRTLDGLLDGKESTIDIMYPGLASDLPWQPRDNVPDTATEIATLQSKADAGDSKAAEQLAKELSWGIDTQPNSEKALEILQALADKRNAVATFTLSNMYLAGQGVPRDIPRALALRTKAADLDDTGNIAAMLAFRAYALNTRYSTESICWLEKAAEKRVLFGQKASPNGSASAKLGDIYSADSDYSRAAYWYHKAVADGDQSAVEKLKETNARLSPDLARAVDEQLKQTADSGDQMRGLAGINYSGGNSAGASAAKPALPQAATLEKSDAQNQQVRSLLQISATQWKGNMYDAVVQLPSGGSVGAAENAACLGNVNAMKQLIKKGGVAYKFEACTHAAAALLKSGYILLATEWDDRGCTGGALIACRKLGEILEQIGDIAWEKNNKQAAIKIWHTSCDDYKNSYACTSLKYRGGENIDLDAAKRAYDEAKQAAMGQYDAAVDADASHQSAFLSVLEAVNQGLSAATKSTSNAPQGGDPIKQSLNQSLANLNAAGQNAQAASQNANQRGMGQPSNSGSNSSDSSADSVDFTPSSSSGGSGTYTGPNADWVHRLLGRVGSWSCPSSPTAQDGAPPQVQAGAISIRDQYVKSAVLEAWAAECYARQQRDSTAQEHASAMMKSIQEAQSLCSSASVIAGGPAPATMSIVGCNGSQPNSSSSGTSRPTPTPQLTNGCIRITNVVFKSTAEISTLAFDIVNNCQVSVGVAVFFHQYSRDTCLHGQIYTSTPGITVHGGRDTPINQMETKFVALPTDPRQKGPDLTEFLVPAACSNPWLGFN